MHGRAQALESETVPMSEIFAKPRLPILLESATTITRAAAATSARLVCASTSWWVVKPADALTPSTPMIAMSRLMFASTSSASGPTSS
jgi:hypothetical protein